MNLSVSQSRSLGKLLAVIMVIWLASYSFFRLFVVSTDSGLRGFQYEADDHRRLPKIVLSPSTSKSMQFLDWIFIPIASVDKLITGDCFRFEVEKIFEREFE